MSHLYSNFSMVSSSRGRSVGTRSSKHVEALAEEIYEVISEKLMGVN